MANNLLLNVLGFPAVNRDLTVEVRDPLTAQVVRTAKPFLDGTVRLPDVDPGAYELAVLHPNLALPVVRRPIRILPSGDTRVSVLIDPSAVPQHTDRRHPRRQPRTGPRHRHLRRGNRGAAGPQAAGRGDPRRRLEHDGLRGPRPGQRRRRTHPAGQPHRPRPPGTGQQVRRDVGQLRPVGQHAERLDDRTAAPDPGAAGAQADRRSGVGRPAPRRGLQAVVHAGGQPGHQRHRVAAGVRAPGPRRRPATHRRGLAGAGDPARPA